MRKEERLPLRGAAEDADDYSERRRPLPTIPPPRRQSPRVSGAARPAAMRARRAGRARSAPRRARSTRASVRGC
ncbi:hypothetical protein CVS37_17645 [Burkholderia lata]|nr:hypothetical protein CVS37_17645 [Burkholderia lata]